MNRDEKKAGAGKDYAARMKYKDISAKYDVPVNTLKSWRNRYHWKRGAPATEGVHPKTKKDAPKIIDELEENGDLTEKQKRFCLFYLQRFNATWAYMKAYDASYETANTNGPLLLVKTGIQTQLASLKKAVMGDIHLTTTDLAKEYAKQAFADLGDYVDFGTKQEIVRDGWYKPIKDKVKGGYLKADVSFVHLKDKKEVDTSVLKGIHIGRDGVVVELYDKQKALGELMKYLDDDNPADENVTINFIRSDRRDKDGNQRGS